MNDQLTFEFKWFSLLGAAVTLFLVINLVYLLFALLVPILDRYYGTELTTKFGLIFGPGADAEAFGRPPMEIVREKPAVMAVKVTVYDMLSGLYMAVAVLHFGLLWFGLRQGHIWALWMLALADLAIVLYYLLAVRHFAHVVPLGPSDLHPFVLIPAILLPVATVLGWVGLH